MGLVGHLNGGNEVVSIARALLLGGDDRGLHQVLEGLLGLLLEGTAGLLAHKLALGARAGRGLRALPVAAGGLAHGAALGLLRLTYIPANGRLAHALALGAALLRRALVNRAAHAADGCVALDLALGARHLLAMHLVQTRACE
jgi:hypothetical protein